MIPEDILEFARKNTEYAYKNNQVVIKDLEIQTGETTRKRCFRNGIKIEASLLKEGDFYWIKNEGNKIGPIKENQAIRLSPTKHVKIPPQASKTYSIKKRIKFYLRNYGTLGGVKRIAKIILYDLKNKIIHPKAIRKKKKDLKKEEGITFIVKDINSSTVTLECYDFGGIYDYYINNEIDRYPPQVPENYYATAYFAYNCIRLSSLEEKKKYLDAGKKALDFAVKNYTSYPFSEIVFEHTDFKFFPILEAYNQLDKKPSDILEYKEATYDPVNVYALRIQNLSHLEGKEKKIAKYLDILAKNQTEEGLIQDNYPPFYLNSKDITYHQFALACLFRAKGNLQNVQNKKRLITLINKGISFSEKILFRNGEISYYGRGSNNIYHIASAIYAFSCAHSQNSENYLPVIKRLFHYLSKNNDKWLPTALTEDRERMIGWNHCEMPYNMQTSYFLLHAFDTLKNLSSEKEYKENKREKEIFLPKSGFYHFSNENYEICLINGGEQLTWAAGRHATGAAGIANLTVNKSGTTLALDYLNNNIPITDLPRIKIEGEFLFPKEYEIKKRDKGCLLEAEYKNIHIKKEYKFTKDSIKTITECEFYPPLSKVRIDGICNLPRGKYQKLNFEVEEASDYVVEEEKDEIIESNPKGKGRLFKYGFFEKDKISEKTIVKVEGKISVKQ